ncbi:MAG: GNAT family N-acetyltransferase [Chloroflexota bacterium]
MSTAMPALETERLVIRPFVLDDLEAVHRVLSDAWNEAEDERATRLPERARWLRWTVANDEELALLRQPPYGDRAMVLRETGELIGSAGLVPSLGPFGQVPGFPAHQGSRSWYPEVGLFWAVDPSYQRRGYATEAGRALVAYAFDALHLGRIIATTEHTNERSIAVMRAVDMRILRNPLPDPPWFQVVGVLERS